MIKLLNILIEGFCSITEPQTLPLNVGGTVLMKGPNGFGKTTLFSAIAWVLFGKNLKGKSEVNTWKKYQPKDYRGTKVTLTWESERGVFRVTRCQKYTAKLEDGAKGGDRIILVKDGEILNIKGKVKLQEAINLNLGCSYELFISSIMFGQGMKRLIQENNTDKKKIFEEIFNLEYLTVARTIAQEERSQIYSEYQKADSEYASLTKQLNMLRQTFKDLKEKEDTWTAVNTRNISRHKSELKKVKQRISKLIGQVEGTDYGEVYQNHKDRIFTLEKLLEQAEQIQDTPLIKVVKATIKLLRAKEIDKAINNLERIQVSFIRAEDLRRDIESEQKALYEAKDKYREQKDLNDDIESLKEKAESLRSYIHELKSSKVKEVSPKYLKRIHNIEKELRTISEVKDKLEGQLDDYNWVLNDPLSNNGIKAFLFDSSLQALNGNLEKYAEILGFRIEFNIDLDSARKEFVTLIERDGVIIEYDELSGGEKALVNLTMCLALHETLTLSKGTNILLLDEVFENLDQDNIELVISLIRTLSEGKTIFLISHIENLPFGNCKVLEVSKNNGQTHYSHL